MLSGCSPKLTQSFIDKYDTPKLTNECPDFSGVYFADGPAEPFNILHVTSTSFSERYPKDANYHITIKQHKSSVDVELRTMEGKLIHRYIINMIYWEPSQIVKYKSKGKMQIAYGHRISAGCIDNTFYLREFMARHRAQWGGGHRSFRERKMTLLPNGDIQTYFKDYTTWHGPFGGTKEHKPRISNGLLEKLGNN
jgi:hypothetical protein